MWGTDQGASIEPQGLIKLVKISELLKIFRDEKSCYQREKSIRKN